MAKEPKLKCTCKGVEEAAKREEERMKKANAADFMCKRAADEILYGGWNQCQCAASKLKIQGPWKLLKDEQPGKEFQDPDNKEVSILMEIVVGLHNGKGFFFARWNYLVDCFVAEYENDVLGPETFAYHTKLWKPVAEVSDQLWGSTFPSIQSSKGY